MSHRNARLTVHGRRILIERVLAGRPVAHVAAETGISRATGYKRVSRRRAEGDAGPGELVHVDIKKLGNRPVIGYSYIHSAVDDHSRLAYSEVMPDERQHTAIAFWQRAHAFFTSHGITVQRVLTDNGSCYKSKLFTQMLTAAGITHKKIRPYRPQTNGKVERFNRTLLDKWAYLKPYTSNTERTHALADFLHTYNHHRCHTAFQGQTPISRVNNPAGQYT